MRRITVFSMIALVAIYFTDCKNDDPGPDNNISQPEFNPSLTYGTMTDQDGNEYKTITIGTQTWMAENLRTKKYRDGTPIPEVTNSIDWNNLRNGACCTYNNTVSIDTIATYGRLYNWYTVSDSRNIAPEGWHIPTYSEWIQLCNNMGGVNGAGGRLKETGIAHWLDPNIGADNSSGFTGLPGGEREGDFPGVEPSSTPASFSGAGEFGWWWSFTDDDNEWVAKSTFLPYYLEIAAPDYNPPKTSGLSIRCVKD